MPVVYWWRAELQGFERALLTGGLIQQCQIERGVAGQYLGIAGVIDLLRIESREQDALSGC